MDQVRRLVADERRWIKAARRPNDLLLFCGGLLGLGVWELLFGIGA